MHQSEMQTKKSIRDTDLSMCVGASGSVCVRIQKAAIVKEGLLHKKERDKDREKER